MRKIIKSDTEYIMEEGNDGFIFIIRENEYEKAVVVGEITVAAAEKFLNVLADNDVLPGHLLPVAEDHDFATITLTSAF